MIRTAHQNRISVPMPSANVSYKLLDANPWRVGLTIYNQSGNTIYVTFGDVSNSASPTLVIGSYQSWTMFGPVIWTGPISAIRNAGNGASLAAAITEILH